MYTSATAMTVLQLVLSCPNTVKYSKTTYHAHNIQVDNLVKAKLSNWMIARDRLQCCQPDE